MCGAVLLQDSTAECCCVRRDPDKAQLIVGVISCIMFAVRRYINKTFQHRARAHTSVSAPAVELGSQQRISTGHRDRYQGVGGHVTAIAVR